VFDDAESHKNRGKSGASYVAIEGDVACDYPVFPDVSGSSVFISNCCVGCKLYPLVAFYHSRGAVILFAGLDICESIIRGQVSILRPHLLVFVCGLVLVEGDSRVRQPRVSRRECSWRRLSRGCCEA
jgi:hypothetical protein